MLISIVGSSLPNFDCLPYVRSWLAQGRRDANSTAGPSRKLAVRVTNELAQSSVELAVKCYFIMKHMYTARFILCVKP